MPVENVNCVKVKGNAKNSCPKNWFSTFKVISLNLRFLEGTSFSLNKIIGFSEVQIFLDPLIIAPNTKIHSVFAVIYFFNDATQREERRL